MTSSYDLSPEADLFHELLVVPEQVLLIDDAVLPVADGCHLNLVGLSRGVEAVALCNGHGLGEGAFHDTNDRSPFALTKLDRMLFDSRVRRPNEHRLQVIDVLVETFRDVAIGPVDENVV